MVRYQPAPTEVFVPRKRAPIAEWQDPAAGQKMAYSSTRFSTREVDESDDDDGFAEQAPVLRSAIAALNAQARLIDLAIKDDSDAEAGPSARTQGLLNSYQAQGADLQRQVHRK